MLYNFKTYTNADDYWICSDWDGWDAWYVVRKHYKLRSFIPRSRKQLKYSMPWYRKERPTDNFISFHYLWYDGPHIALWVWRFGIGA